MFARVATIAILASSFVSAAPAAADVPLSKLGAGVKAPSTGTTNTSGYAEPMPAGFVQSPDYAVKSDFDFQSLALALHQEWIELAIFRDGFEKFSLAEYQAANLTADDMYLINFMADQEVGHSHVLSNLLGDNAPKSCTYKYPYSDVRSFLEFNIELTRFGESGVYGFLENLDNRADAQILLQSITTEARQQMVFRQLEGRFPMPVYFETGITQSMAWTLLSQYIVSCPSQPQNLTWTIFPHLNVTDTKPLSLTSGAGVSHNTTAFSAPGDTITLAWDAPGKKQGPYDQYTKKGAYATNSSSKYAGFVSQYNVTWVEINKTSTYAGTVIQPGGGVFNLLPSDTAVNGTMFIVLASDNPHLTPANLSLINNYITAGPALYASG
ncbi:uncharacterized protein L969DRAFT_96473 [Mixia osmundae IAM 14324]|uniref:Rds1 protein n=1 Tax=Mixia osmundae (strain CBS 9802 / IAM 14324 / JCM 22182 / KY 12970) TaxID=764103 RepID=G7DUX8_MIXOS|nr:uncharacterized protein L969DRAFT_96473 [Mixia osmundae IAM 14324]KEI37395.1 hypothetical protein L969DRAFT_96473 [Mixia osmundae IAM 14324]GAA94388.1 hypothetical protein E5Q_01039 [Mixia osmundae IAM 14324]